MTNKKKLLLFGAIWLSLQFILVFCKWPIVFISDEILYKRISYSLFQWKPALSWHYPILYPALISLGFFFRSHFYEAMLVVNILSKGIGLFLIWKLLRKETDEDRALRMLVLIGFSPIYFLYSRVLMAENLACPLLIINVLYHEHYRKKMAEGAGGRRLAYTLGAALLSLSLFWTKYLLVVTLPVLCLFWCAPLLTGGEGAWAKLFSFVKEGAVYTSAVVFCLLAYAGIYALRTDQPFTLDLLTGTMGFGAASGPANNGYAMSAGWIWIMSYVLYALLGAVFAVVGMIADTKAVLLKENRAIVALSGTLILVLLYVSARHSTHVDYNEGWRMISLCGRYVAYTTPLLSICWMRTSNPADREQAGAVRRIGAGAAGIAIVWVAYELLYVFSPGVEQSASWLTGIRAADNAGFTNMGHSFCVIYCIGICAVLLLNRWIGIVLISLLMTVNSFWAVLTCEKYHSKDYEYSYMMKGFLEGHPYDRLDILCVDSGDFSFIEGYLRFYDTGGRFDSIVVRPVGDLQQPLYFDDDNNRYLVAVSMDSLGLDTYRSNQDYFEGREDWRNVFLRWDSSSFLTSEREWEVSYSEEGRMQISCQGDEKIVFVCGNYILPAKRDREEGLATVTVDGGTLEEDTIYVYDIGNLTVSEINVSTLQK